MPQTPEHVRPLLHDITFTGAVKLLLQLIETPENSGIFYRISKSFLKSIRLALQSNFLSGVDWRTIYRTVHVCPNTSWLLLIFMIITHFIKHSKHSILIFNCRRAMSILPCATTVHIWTGLWGDFQRGSLGYLDHRNPKTDVQRGVQGTMERHVADCQWITSV